MRVVCQRLILVVLGLCVFATFARAEATNPTMTVDGAGFFKDRLLGQQFETLFVAENSFYGPADVEDAALILISEVQNDGYLEAKVEATITDTAGDIITADWDKELDVFLPKELRAVKVEFKVIPGPRFHYDTVTVQGNEVLSFDEVASFFYTEPFLFGGNKSKVFTNPQFVAGVQNLQAHLKNLGYQNAQVAGDVVELDTATGAIDVRITISQGPSHILKDIILEAPPEDPIKHAHAKWLHKPYNHFLRQDIIQGIRNDYYALGFVDVQFKHETTATPVSPEIVEVVLKISITPGKQFKIASIHFEGADSVRQSLLEKQLKLQAGDNLNPGLLDESRLNLSRLGLFQKVDVRQEDKPGNERSITFTMKERTTWEVDALVGWGSYENLRAGIMAEKANALGRGHRLQFKTIVSTKSLLGESGYLIPNFLESQFPLSTKLFYLEREELSFDRQELGVSFGSSIHLERLDMTVDAVYNFESLDAEINSRGGTSTGPDNVRSGSLEMRFSRDKRDNPLNPQSGYRFFGDFEWGSEALGGQVDYQSAEIGLSFHQEIKRGLIWHASIYHAAVGSFYKSQNQVPTNKLLYPGGENSIRGYERGGAAPLDNAGDFLGAKSMVLVNLELEQRLSNAISIVGFLDSLGMTKNIDEYPFDEYLSSVGLGIRLRTFMGPIRLEYGHNLDQRIGDPSGTFHLTIGYPF